VCAHCGKFGICTTLAYMLRWDCELCVRVGVNDTMDVGNVSDRVRVGASVGSCVWEAAQTARWGC